MRTFVAPQSRITSDRLPCAMLAGAFFAATLLSGTPIAAQSPTRNAVTSTSSKPQQARRHRTRSHRQLKVQEPVPEAQTPPPPPMPNWPINDKPSPASVVWDATGLRISASNASLQQILSEVSTETGTKVEGLGADQRVYGEFGPGKARDVLAQLLQGSGYNLLLAGDIGQGAPRQLILSPRRTGPADTPNIGATMDRAQQESDEDISEQPEEQPPPVQAPQMPIPQRPGFGPSGPVRTPQQVMEEMQQRQMLQQQQMQQQQQQQQQNPPPQ